MAAGYMITEDDIIVMSATSIELPDFPPVKGVTRGHLHVIKYNK